ncbi:MAG: helix-turn-helix domain-containing protein [Cellulosilyticaceae bacterium]
MTQSLMEIILNPVRMRIIQYMLTNKVSTALEMGKVLNDIPQTSLYRHIKKLADSGILEVESENRIRGTVEKLYRLAPNPFKGELTNKEMLQSIYTFMFTVLGDFEEYFKGDDIDPVRDKLLVQNAILCLDDTEFMNFAADLGKVFEKYINNTVSQERKPRRIATIISPVNIHTK